MWGGVKHRRQYGDLFRNWSATKGLESVRASLYTEPRPWYLAFSLHQHRHLLQDYQCARLLAWCTTVLQLRTDVTSKKEAYRYAHETLHMLSHSHKVGSETLLQCFRLCAVGKDLSSAFNWYQYWIESQNDGADSLWPLVWLLRIAYESPSDDSVEDMAAAVRDAYLARLGVPSDARAVSALVPAQHFSPESQEEDAQWAAFRCAFGALQPRLRDGRLRGFVESLTLASDLAVSATPMSTATEAWLRQGWPQPSHHHVFANLEQGVSKGLAGRPTVTQPFLRDSLLHPDFVAQLEEAAFVRHDAKAVVALLQRYKDEVQSEKQRRERTSTRRAEEELWRQYADPCAQRFRHALVEEGGLTPELYHYLIAALVTAHPSAALRTVDRMTAANLRVLDVTRALVLIAARGAPDEQLRLFKAQLEEMDSRRRLDADFDISKAVEHYWKFEYTNFFHYQNRLDDAAFYRLLLDGLAPAEVQRLVLDAQVCGPTATTEDLVVLSVPLRQALAEHFRHQLGRAAVEEAMNAITQHVPKLDLSLVNSTPHFGNYVLPETDAIATDLASLRDRLRGVDTIYVLDTSFVESSEGFLSLGTDDKAREKSSLVLVPFVVLQQLADSVAQSSTFVTFDPTLQDGLREEPLLASQRLRALAAMTAPHSTTTTGTAGRQARLLHFSESLLAHGSTADSQEGSPATDDNEHLLLIVAMTRALCPASAAVVLCTDDPRLQARVEEAAARQQLFAGPVQILSTPPPEEVVDTDQVGGLVDDNPRLEMDAEQFVPKLTPSMAASGHVPRSAQASLTPVPSEDATTRASPESEEADSDALDSPWLSLLEDSASTAAEASNPTAYTATDASLAAAPPRTVAVQSTVAAPESEPDMDDLMSLYETPHDVIPVGAKMMEASRLTSVFNEFDSADPYERAQAAEERAARRSRLEAEGGGSRPRRLSALEREFLQNRGTSNKQRYQLARSMSNQSGGRVPFNFRYKVVEADITNPRNASLRRAYEQGIEKKRDHFKRKNQR